MKKLLFTVMAAMCAVSLYSIDFTVTFPGVFGALRTYTLDDVTTTKENNSIILKFKEDFSFHLNKTDRKLVNQIYLDSKQFFDTTSVIDRYVFTSSTQYGKIYVLDTKSTKDDWVMIQIDQYSVRGNWRTLQDFCRETLKYLDEPEAAPEVVPVDSVSPQPENVQLAPEIPQENN